MNSFDHLLRDKGKETKHSLWSILTRKEIMMSATSKEEEGVQGGGRGGEGYQSNNLLRLFFILKGKNVQMKKRMTIPFQMLMEVTGGIEKEERLASATPSSIRIKILRSFWS